MIYGGKENEDRKLWACFDHFPLVGEFLNYQDGNSWHWKAEITYADEVMD
jgi:hypothetical protein